MKSKHLIQRIAVLGALAAVLAVIVACGGGGVSQSDYDAAKKESADLQQRVTDLEATAAASSGITPLIGAKSVPSLAPTPVATPTPAGQTPKPKATTPAAYGEPVGPFYFYVETLATTHQSQFNIASTVACTPSSAFIRGQRIVWRFEVVDMSTGKRLTDADSPTVKVKLPNGDEATGRFSQRAGGSVPDAPWMWSANWDVPLDFPLGGIDYTINVTTKDGRTGTFKTPALVGPDADSRIKVVG